ncbi:phage portal protein [Candidatus Dependentiae bacterium]|nr:MAG: phage portal protein [Candidatus Dependentiae bacterium]
MADNWLSKVFNRKTKAPDVRGSRIIRLGDNEVPVTEDTAMQVSAFYRGVIYIATQIGKLPWNIKDKNNNILYNDLSYLTRLAPNPEMNSMFFRIAMIFNAIVRGNSYAEIVRAPNGKIKEMWFLDPRTVDIVRSTSGDLLYRVRGYQKEVILLPNEVFHIKNFHTKDGITGLGVIEYANETINISRGADKFAGALFNNGGLPSGTLSTDGVLTDEVFERIKSQWKENHGGRKAGGIALLEQGVKFNPISLGPDVLQFLDSRKFGVLEIARFLGLPPTKLYDIDANSYNTQEQSNLEVASDTLDTWARSFEMEADIKLLNGQYNGNKSDMDMYQLSRGDMTVRSSYYSKMMQVGAISPNEIRVREGYAPYEGGDRYYIAVNNYTPSDRLDEVIDSQVQKSGNKAPSGVVSNELEKAVIKLLEDSSER